jgi:predicted ATPase
VPLVAEILSVPIPGDRYPALDLNAKQKREQTLDVISGWLIELAERRPVLQVGEDLHWADPTTLELIGLYIEQSPTVAMLNVFTYRPEFVPNWSMRSHMTPITLNRLERPEAEALIHHQAGAKEIPGAVVEHIVAKADGVPLYVEELTKTILESDYIHEEAERFTLKGPLSELPIPTTLQDSLMARLDRFPAVREVAQLGAVLGREFAYRMLCALAPHEEAVVQSGLRQLVQDELLYQRGRPPRSRYIFKHALIQDAAYQSLLKRTRQQCHERIVTLLEENFPETVEAHPELLAHHCTEAGAVEPAVAYWRRAGERAREQSANLEAIAHFSKGIAVLSELSDDRARARQELPLQVALGHASIVAKGHGAPEALAALGRARSLCDQLDDASELLPTLFGLWRFSVAAQPLKETLDFAMQLRRLAEEQRDTEPHVIAHYALGYTALCMGKLRDARANVDEGIARYLPDHRRAEIYRTAQDPGVACRGYSAMTEWLLGFPERAQERLRASVALAEELADPYSLAYALGFTGGIVSEMCGNDDQNRLLVERALEVAEARGYPIWIVYARILKNSARFKNQPSDAALNELQKSVASVPDLGVCINTPYFMTLLAKALQQAGRIDAGLRVLEDARRSIDARDERWWEPEVHRLHGVLLLHDGTHHVGEAGQLFQQALDIARAQEGKSLELRAATSLARLWQRQGRQDEARHVLETCYDWFSKGFDMADLVEAKTFLNELSGS